MLVCCGKTTVGKVQVGKLAPNVVTLHCTYGKIIRRERSEGVRRGNPISIATLLITLAHLTLDIENKNPHTHPWMASGPEKRFFFGVCT